jgi:Obg family GTPase CgtA
MADFIDFAKIKVVAGNGGNGVASIRREKFKPMAGPDGGDGGNGGSISFQASTRINSLIDYKYASQIKADSGGHGQGKLKNGSKGTDLTKLVPIGTQIKTRTGKLIADLVENGQSITVVHGGIGGLGNARLATPQRKAPGFALLGEPGEELELTLELKLVADVALVGYPSAGKSTLISSMSNSRPKIAAYPFTTLHPNLGVVKVENSSFVVTDVPGLIEGAAQGRGLGLEFLKHIERVSVIVHVIDCAPLEPDRDPISDFKIVDHEINTYLNQLANPASTTSTLDTASTLETTTSYTAAQNIKTSENDSATVTAKTATSLSKTSAVPAPETTTSTASPSDTASTNTAALNVAELNIATSIAGTSDPTTTNTDSINLPNAQTKIIVLNKIDLPESQSNAEKFRTEFEKLGLPVFLLSGVTKAGVHQLIYYLNDQVQKNLQQRLSLTAKTIPVLRPKALNDSGYKIYRVGDHRFQVFGDKLRRWVTQTDMDNPEALGYLSDRLAKLPIDADLVAAGAEAGDDIMIGDSQIHITMEFSPNFSLSREGSPRGTDKRIDLQNRLTRKEKKTRYQEFLESKNETF